VLTLDLLEEKYALGAAHSLANYSFFMGINQGNLEEALRINNENVCGITDDGLYFHNNEGILANYPEFLEKLFSRSNSLVALHSEDDQIIRRNEKIYQSVKESDFPSNIHELIRSKEACTSATRRVVDIARKHGNRLHFFHISTEDECLMFDTGVGIRDKRITAEACVHHLWFSADDYDEMGSLIKWNPAIKYSTDRDAIRKAVLDNKIDIIATDHAPHTLTEKKEKYAKCPSGGPLVQHALPAMLQGVHEGWITLERVVEKMAHAPAICFRMPDRGFIREGYYADLVLVDMHQPWKVETSNILYHCGWSPFMNQTFESRVISTFVNGTQVYNKGTFDESFRGMRLKFRKP
jgi:dihydroorotase